MTIVDYLLNKNWLFVDFLVLVFSTESFHLELHSTFLSNTQRHEKVHLLVCSGSDTVVFILPMRD